MMRHAGVVCGIVMLCSVMGRAQGAGRESTVAVVSGQRISQESEIGKAGQARVLALQRERAGQLQARQQALSDLRLRLAEATDPSVRADLERQETVQQADLGRATAQAQADIQTLQRQISVEVQVRVRAALDEILKGRGVSVVLQRETAVVWSAPGLDVTTEVIAWLDNARTSEPNAAQ